MSRRRGSGRGRCPAAGRSLAAFRDTSHRSVVAVALLVLGAYCRWRRRRPSTPSPRPGNRSQELAARERYRWPDGSGCFLVIVVGYAVTVAARRQDRAAERPPSRKTRPDCPTSVRSAPRHHVASTPGWLGASGSGRPCSGPVGDRLDRTVPEETSATTKTSTMIVRSPSSSMACWKTPPGLGQLRLGCHHEDAARRGNQADHEERLRHERVLAEGDLTYRGARRRSRRAGPA